MAAWHLSQHPLFASSQRIACYLAHQDELDTAPLLQLIWQAKKVCYVPVLMEGKALEFARYNQGDRLRPNQFHIMQPEKDTRKLAAEKLDLVIMPLVAFDVMGHRLGAGGGYYDRTFAFMHAIKPKKPVLLGYGYSAQRADALPGDPWDVMMYGVVTEEGVMVV